MRFAVALSSFAFLALAGCDADVRREQAKEAGPEKEAEQQAVEEPKAPAVVAGDKKPLAVLIADIDASDKEVRYAAVSALGSIRFGDDEVQRNKVIAVLGKALRSDDDTMRFVASQALTNFGRHALPIYFEAIKDKNVDVRLRAAQDLGSVAHWPLQNTGKGSALGRLDEEIAVSPDTVVDVLRATLIADKNDEVRRSAAISLASISESTDRAFLALFGVLKDGDVAARTCAIDALGRTRLEQRRKAVPQLAAILADADDGVRERAVRALAQMRNEAWAALPALLTASKGQDQVAKAAGDALKQIDKAPRAAAPSLAPFLSDPEPAVRMKVVALLSQLEENDAQCLAALLELVKRRDSTIRRESATLLSRYGSAAKEAIPALIEVVRTDTDESTVMAAVHGLAKIGPNAKSALPALRALEKDYQRKMDDSLAGLQKSSAKAIESIRRSHQMKVDTVRTAIAKIDE